MIPPCMLVLASLDHIPSTSHHQHMSCFFTTAPRVPRVCPKPRLARTVLFQPSVPRPGRMFHPTSRPGHAVYCGTSIETAVMHQGAARTCCAHVSWPEVEGSKALVKPEHSADFARRHRGHRAGFHPSTLRSAFQCHSMLLHRRVGVYHPVLRRHGFSPDGVSHARSNVHI